MINHNCVELKKTKIGHFLFLPLEIIGEIKDVYIKEILTVAGTVVQTILHWTVIFSMVRSENWI